MDALPIQETRESAYKSQVPGVMHACGHDAHTTIGLGTAEVLAGMKDRLRGTIKFLFQPAEEGAPQGEEGGAALMIKEGALENPRPGAIFGLHVDGERDAGTLAYQAGPASSAYDRFDITIHGKMSQSHRPHQGVDAIVVASECVTALQTIHSRRLEPTHSLVITIGVFRGGLRCNILADEVKLEGSMRSTDPETRTMAMEAMARILGGVTTAHGATYELKFSDRLPMMQNDPALTRAILPALRRAAGAAQVVEQSPRMGSEDFAFYQEVIPGSFFRLGVRNRAKGILSATHTPDFDVDEDALVLGVKAMAGVVVDYLDREAVKR
jgi:amidohydrolase